MNVPQELAELSQWVLWRDEDGQKIPYSAIRPGKASSTGEETWSHHLPAQTKYELSLANGHPFSGIGFVFTTNDPYCGIDLDGCRDPDTGVIAEWAQLIIDDCQTYAEVSPSGTGVKLFCRGKLPAPKGKKIPLPDAPRIVDKSPAIEFYDHARYFTFTGNHLPGTPLECSDCQVIIDMQWRNLVAPEPAPPATPPAPFITSKGSGDDNRAYRCNKYVAEMDPSIAGEGGDEALYAVGCECARFDLNHQDALSVMHEFNARCKPAWPVSRLLYKIEQGRKTVAAEGAIGIRLREDRQQERQQPVDLSGILTPPQNYAKPKAPADEPSAKQANGAGLSASTLWRRFPTSLLPGVVAEFVQAAARSIDCDESMVALPTICTLAGAIGGTRAAMLKSGWSEPSVIWGAVIAESGSKKSPAIDSPLKAIIRQEMANIKAHEQELLQYNAALSR